MFDWFKNKKLEKKLRANLVDLKNMILDIQISETASAKELEEFYAKIAAWNRVLNEKQLELFTVAKRLTSEDKLEILKHLDTCINNYSMKIIKINDVLIKCLEEETISPDTKVEIINFGKDNIAKSDQTINTLRDLAKAIALGNK